MEEKERYEVMSPSLNGYAYIHDFKTDNVLNTYDSCDLLNQQSKRIKELENENKQLKKQLEQDKISFAVKQLEKAKNKIESKVESIYKILDDLNIKIVGESTSRELNAYEEIAKDIDNQIKQLKEGK